MLSGAKVTRQFRTYLFGLIVWDFSWYVSDIFVDVVGCCIVGSESS